MDKGRKAVKTTQERDVEGFEPRWQQWRGREVKVTVAFWWVLKGEMTAFAKRLDVECERQKSKVSPNFWPEQLEEQSCHHLE